MRYDSVFLKALFVTSLIGTPALSSEPPQRRSLELELEEIQGSSGYEVEVVRLLPEGKRGNMEKFSLKNTIWKATLSPGHYSMRVRSLDSRGVPGDWNEPKDFMIKLFSPKLSTPNDLAVINSKDSKDEKIDFNWEPGEKAQGYKIEIKDQKNNIIFQNETKDTTITAILPVGADYSWQITPSNKSLETEGETFSPRRLKIMGKKLDSPEILKIADIETKFLAWKPVPNAEKYEVQLEFKKEGLWRIFRMWSISQTTLKVGRALETGAYRLKIKATAYDRVDSDESIKEFETESSLGDDIQRASYQLSKRFFVRLGLAPGFFNYKNNNLDLDTNSSVSTYGLSAALTVGTWFKPRSPWGLLATVETEAIPLSGTFSTYSSLTLLGVRKFNLGTSSQIRIYLGLQRADVPNVAADIYGNISQSKIGITSPIAKMAYFYGVSPTVGFHISAQFSASVEGDSSNNTSGGSSNNNTKPSEQVGLGISKRLRENLLGNIDYYYRDQQAAYFHMNDSGFPNVSGGSNQVELTSHNIMISLELGF